LFLESGALKTKIGYVVICNTGGEKKGRAFQNDTLLQLLLKQFISIFFFYSTMTG